MPWGQGRGMDQTSDITSRDTHSRQTMVLLSSAIRNGWQIPDTVLRAAPAVVANLLVNGGDREKLRAAEVLIRMRESNIAALELADKLERLDGGSSTERIEFAPIVLRSRAAND